MDLTNYKPPIKNLHAPTSPRSEAIDQLAKLLNAPFTAILHKTMGKNWALTTDEILEIVLTSRSWKTNPPALAGKLLRDKIASKKLKK